MKKYKDLLDNILYIFNGVKYCVMEPDIEQSKNIYPFAKLPSQSYPAKNKDVYDSYNDCLREKYCHIIPLTLSIIVFTIVLLCILRGSLVQWSGD